MLNEPEVSKKCPRSVQEVSKKCPTKTGSGPERCRQDVAEYRRCSPITLIVGVPVGGKSEGWGVMPGPLGHREQINSVAYLLCQVPSPCAMKRHSFRHDPLAHGPVRVAAPHARNIVWMPGRQPIVGKHLALWTADSRHQAPLGHLPPTEQGHESVADAHGPITACSLR